MKSDTSTTMKNLLLGAGVGAVVGFIAVRWNSLSLNGNLRVVPSIVLWVVFSLYWSIAARNAAPTEKAESTASTQFHQISLAIAQMLLLFPVIPGLTGKFLPATNPFLALGLFIQAGFFLLAVWARRHLGRNWSAEVRIAVDHQLVRTGPYRYLRHPIYTAMLGMFLGTSVVTGQIQSLLAVLILAALYWRKTSLEEEILLQTFGVDYQDYRHGTWALVPLLY